MSFFFVFFVFLIRLFAQDQYFDSHGLFISTVLSFPVIINCCVLVVSYAYDLYICFCNFVCSFCRVFGYMNR